MNRKLLSAAVALAAAFAAAAGEHTAYVNTFIGTGAMDGGLSGNCYPGATVPFGMVQLCPDTHPSPDWYNAGGYLYTDSIIYGFSHTRLSGTGAADLIDVSLFPSVSRATSSGFSHAEESAGPGYYKVRLADEGITAELTATPRTGIHRYSFPKNAQRNILIDLDHSCQKGSWDRKIIQSQLRRTGPNTIEGYRVITGWAKLRKVYFIAEFSEPIASLEISDGGQKRGGATVVNGRDLKAWLGFGNAGRPLTVRVALSGVSNENARANLAAEAPKAGFKRYAEAADAEWERRLGAIDVKGDSAAMVTFYTAMYHTMIQPNAFSDVNGEYTTPVYTTRKVGEGETQYTTFSLWDTYRAAHPLYTLICPSVNAQFVNSLIRHADDYGYLPVWHLWGQDNYCMIGNHSVPVIAEAIVNGVEGIDEEKAYAAVRNSLTQSHSNSPFDVWEHYGYMPEPLQTQSVSITLEQALLKSRVLHSALGCGRLCFCTVIGLIGPIGLMLVYFGRHAGMVEAVGGGLHTHGDVVAEVAGLAALAEEVHGEEVVHFHALEEDFGSAGEVGTLTGVDGEHGNLDFGHLGGDAVHDGLEFRLCFRNLALGGFVLPVPVVEVAGMENAAAVGEGYHERHAGVGRAVGLDGYAAGE